MATLLEISDELRQLQEVIDLADGEMTPAVDEALTECFANFSSKADSYCALIRHYELTAAARKEEGERLARLVQADTNAARRLKERLKTFMELTGQAKIDTARYKIRVQPNGGKAPLQIDARPSDLPSDCVVATLAIDADAIRQALDDGREIAGVCLLPRSTHLRIT